ncbi:MAG: hypothetical protein ACLGPL_10740 [Acidobacteriota bacterium]
MWADTPLSQLILVGTVHDDPEGFQRARRLLLTHRPDLLFVELSPYGWFFRKRHQGEMCRLLSRNLKAAASRLTIPLREVFRHSSVRAIRGQIALPYEYRAARRIMDMTRVVLTDYSPFSRKWIETWPELISTDNLVALLSQPDDRPSASYRQAAHLIERGTCAIAHEIRIVQGENRLLWERREEHMARKILALLRARRPIRPLFLGGWWHLTRGEWFMTLRDRLNIGPERCRLLDGFA